MRSKAISKRQVTIGILSFVAIVVLMSSSVRAENSNITPTSGVGDLGTDVNTVGTDYTITGGARPGDGVNLFHSFGNFSVGTGDTANFKNESGLPTNNLISRVIGGVRSDIHGTIKTTDFPGTNVYLLNPAGVLFGSEAQLNINGSFHASTADYLKHGTEGVFYVDPESASTLSTAPPTAFGFLGHNPGGIDIDGAELKLPDNRTLSLVGGDIRIENDTQVEVKGGLINIASVASPGDVVPSAPGTTPPDLEVDSFFRLGEIEIKGESSVYAWGDGGGTVLIRGGELVLKDASSISGSATGPTDGSLVDTVGAGIDIQVTGKVLLEGQSNLGTFVYNGVSHDSGGVRIRASEVDLNSGTINSIGYGAYTFEGTDYPPSHGDTGNIEIQADRVTVRNAGIIRSNTGGVGDSGDILIQAKSLELVDDGDIYTLSFGSGTGNAGDIDIQADTIILANPSNSGVSLLSSQTFTSGEAGNISIATNDLQIMDKVFISSNTFGSGKGGDVTIEPKDVALDVTISGVPDYVSGIFSNTLDSSGPGGQVDLTATNVRIMQNGSIQSASYRGSSGPGGTVKLTVDSLELVDGGFLSTHTRGSSKAGNIIVDAGTVKVAGGWLSSRAFGTGAAGNIRIKADSLKMHEGSFVSVSGSVGEGIADAGNIDIGVKRLLLNDSKVLGIVKDGVGGTIRVQAEESVTLIDKGSLNNSSSGEGDSGDIRLSAPQVYLLGGSQLVSNSFNMGDGGTIVVAADTLSMSGIHPEPVVFRGETTYAPSGLFTQTFDTGGAGGNVLVQAGLLDIRDGARIDSSTAGAGKGGSVHVNADRVLVAGADERIQGLLLELDYDPVLAELSSRSMISSSSQEISDGVTATGAGGLIRVEANTIELRDRGLISSATSGAGLGGKIELVAENIYLSGNGLISAESHQGTGQAGTIEITARDSFQSDTGAVRTTADIADGGDVRLTVGRLVYLLDSEITTSVSGGKGTGGNIFIDPVFVVLNNSSIIAKAVSGNGGNINIITDYFIVSSNSNLSASSELGVDGTVNIDALETDVNSSIALLPSEFLDAYALAQKHCGTASTTDERSSLIVTGKGGTAVSPDGYLPSFSLGEETDNRLIDIDYPMHWDSQLASAFQGDYLVAGCRP